MPLSQPVPVIPVGTIVAWSGAVADIPPGWHLCDGTGGTPDLRDRFIVGAGGGYAVGATGGAATVTLTVNEMPAHSHDWSGYTTAVAWYSINSTSANEGQERTVATTVTGGGQAHENRPPYYALCWIMRTG